MDLMKEESSAFVSKNIILHGVLMSIGYAVVLPMAGIVSRYYKVDARLF